jgi:hypothetical protein
MNTRHALLAAAALSLAAGCRVDPCGDHHADLPASLGPAGVALPEAKVCDANASRATLMYWGGRERLDAVGAGALASMASQGWEQLPPNPYVHQDPASPIYVFRRGDDDLSLSLRVTSTPRFGARMWADSVTIYAEHSAAAPRRARR